jgi:hypothetical protein
MPACSERGDREEERRRVGRTREGEGIKEVTH